MTSLPTRAQRLSAAARKAAATRKRLKAARGELQLCSRCQERPPRAGQADCHDCHAKDMRDRRLRARTTVSRNTPLSRGDASGVVAGHLALPV
jgi:hypothetical protein